VEIDPEMTPPPMMPPEMDGASPEDQIRVLRTVMAEHATGMEKLWDNRHNKDNIQTIQMDLAQLNTSFQEFMVPSVKGLLNRVSNLELTLQSRYSKEVIFYDHEWPQFKRTIENLTQSTDRVQKDVDRIERGMDKYQSDYAGHVNISNQRYDELKMKDGHQEVRLRQLEDFTLAWKVKVAMISTLFSGGIAAIVWILNKYT